MFRRLVQHNLVKRGQRYFSNDAKTPTTIIPPSSFIVEVRVLTLKENFVLFSLICLVTVAQIIHLRELDKQWAEDHKRLADLLDKIKRKRSVG